MSQGEVESNFEDAGFRQTGENSPRKQLCCRVPFSSLARERGLIIRTPMQSTARTSFTNQGRVNLIIGIDDNAVALT